MPTRRNERPMLRKRFVYAATDDKQTIIKIGVTTNVAERLTAIEWYAEHSGLVAMGSTFRVIAFVRTARLSEPKALSVATVINKPIHGREWFPWSEPLASTVNQWGVELSIQQSRICTHGFLPYYCTESSCPNRQNTPISQ